MPDLDLLDEPPMPDLPLLDEPLMPDLLEPPMPDLPLLLPLPIIDLEEEGGDGGDGGEGDGGVKGSHSHTQANSGSQTADELLELLLLLRKRLEL